MRDAYANGPLRAWHSITDAAAIARDAKTLARDSTADAARAHGSDAGDFPSLEERLIRDAGYEPVRVGGLDKARMLEDHLPLLFAISQELGGPVFYRYERA